MSAANTLDITNPTPHTMSSREIATLTGKRHDHVVRDIEKMISDVEKDAPNLGHQAKSIGYVRHKDARGYTSSIDLTQDLTYTLVLGYDTVRRLKVVRRWMELERGATPTVRIPKQSRNAQLRAAVALLGTSIKFNTRMGMDLQQARMKALVQVEDETGVDLAKTFGWTVQIAPQQVETLTPTQIGQRLGVGPREANQLLKRAGLQVDSRDAKNRIVWAPTDNGLPYARLEDLSKAHADGTTQAWRWYPKVVDLLRPFSKPKELAS